MSFLIQKKIHDLYKPRLQMFSHAPLPKCATKLSWETVIWLQDEGDCVWYVRTKIFISHKYSFIFDPIQHTHAYSPDETFRVLVLPASLQRLNVVPHSDHVGVIGESLDQGGAGVQLVLW